MTSQELLVLITDTLKGVLDGAIGSLDGKQHKNDRQPHISFTVKESFSIRNPIKPTNPQLKNNFCIHYTKRSIIYLIVLYYAIKSIQYHHVLFLFHLILFVFL